MVIGELFIAWKKILLNDSQWSHSILNYMNTLSLRTLQLFENKGEAAFGSKDYVGINLLLAITLYNVSHSHMNMLKSKDSEGDQSMTSP